MVKDIAFTAYPAKDVKALRDFYRDALGINFSGEFEQDGQLMYDEAQVGNSWFAVMTTQWAEITPGSGVAFEVDDLDKTVESLKQRDLQVEQIYETPVCRIGSFYDPEGNKVTLHQAKGGSS